MKSVLNRAEHDPQELELFMQAIIKKYGPYFVILLAIFAVLYFPEFSEYSLRVDEEFAYSHTGMLKWTPFGRWGTDIVHNFFVIRPLNPYFSMLMFGCCLAASFLMFSRVIQAQPSFFNLLSFAIFAGFPTWYYLIEFKGTLLANGLSILSASAAGYFFSTKNRSALLFVPLLVAAIGIYQSSIFIAVIISIASILFGREDGPRTHTAFFLSFSRLAVLCLVSLLCYFIIWKILLAYFNLEPQYIVGFLNIDMHRCSGFFYPPSNNNLCMRANDVSL